MSHTSGSGGEYPTTIGREREMENMNSKVLLEERTREEGKERRHETMVETRTRGEEGLKEGLYEKSAIAVFPPAEEKAKCEPILKEMNLCNSGLAGFTAPREVTEGMLGAAASHSCSMTSFNVMPCRYE
jgi:hypothetical protein